MAILDPVKLVIDNYPEGQTEMLPVVNNPENEELGSREVPFGKELYIERDDFMEEPPKKYFRMFPGNEVRLMNAYFVKCTGCVKDENGKVVEVHGTYDPESRGGNSPDGRKVKGTIHWVSATESVKAQVRLYEECSMLGAVLGNVVFLYQRALPLGNPGLAVYGSFSGIFLGSWVVALGEVVNIYAILIRRIGLVKGIGLVILSMALGKVVGSLWFFFF